MKIPLSLYIHIPWCVKKCPYCDFNSHALQDRLPESKYLDCLIEDLKHDLDYIQQRKIGSVFFGGGTPSLITPLGIESLLTRILDVAPFAEDIEITLETNPGTVEHHKLADYRQAGINRISLGAQSFNDQHLSRLGRIHKANDTIRVIEQIHEANFRSFNIDIMHGLPDQTLDQALQDLDTACSFNPPHLSWYQLTIEPNTYFAKYPPQIPNCDQAWVIQEAGEEILQQNKYAHYEVSAFAKDNQQCQHNLNYWTFGDYLGIGAGAHGKITNLQTQQIIRTKKTRNPKDYLDPSKQYRLPNTVVEKCELPSEFMLNQLRLLQDFSVAHFCDRTGLQASRIIGILEEAQAKDLVRFTNQTVHVTELGRRFLNELIAMFLEEEIG